MRQACRTRRRDAALDDDMLRLIFTCCHPAFAAEAQVALTLRTVCGLTTAQVARAFLVVRRRDGAAAGARQAEDPRRRHSLRDAGARRAGAAAARGAGGDLPGVHRGLCRDLGRGSDAAGSRAGSDPARPPARRAAAAARRDQGAAGADAAARCAPRRPRDAQAATSCCWRTRTAALGPRQIAEGLALVEPALRSPGRPNPTRCRPRSPRCTRRRRARRRPTGRRSSASTRCCCASALAGDRAQPRRRAVDGRRPGARRCIWSMRWPRAASSTATTLLPAVRADLLRRLGRVDEAREAYLAASAATQLEPLRRLYARRLVEMNE